MIQVSSKLTATEIRDLVGNSPIIIEIGAHEGEDTKVFLDAMPGAQVFCFEPEPRVWPKLVKTLRPYDGRVVIYHEAVGAVDGDVPFYASTGKVGDRDDWTLSGSIRRPTGHVRRSPEIKFRVPAMVPCVRLDSWLANHPEVKGIDLIWADVQGAQTDLIAGGIQTLRRARYLYIECHTEPLYDGEPTQADLLCTLKVLAGFRPLACHEGYNFLLER